MTNVETIEAVAPLPEESAAARPSRWDRFEAVLGRGSELLNPILVKEARQALRSKQFAITFLTLLAAGWLWSILGLAIVSETVEYATSGAMMFTGYAMILSFPLIVGAPFWGFYSLASERQDRTYELISITTLGARQVLSGKLASAALQIIMYLSALFPSLAFTYLLRGIDVFVILLTVTYMSLASLGLAMVGLLLASIAATRQVQIVMTLIFVAVLVGVEILAIALLGEEVPFELSSDDPTTWQVSLALLSIYVCFFVQFFLAVRSQLLSETQNRSTALRVSMLANQTVFFIWLVWLDVTFPQSLEKYFVIVCFSAIGWYVGGMFVTGESAHLSPRVKRELPQSILGRVFLTWLAPGPASGYMFVLTSFAAMCLTAIVFTAISASQFKSAATLFGRAASLYDIVLFDTAVALLLLCYLTIYLGLGKLLLGWMSRYRVVGLPMRIAVHLMFLMLGVFPPLILRLSLSLGGRSDYTILQLTDPFETLIEFPISGFFPELAAVLILLPLAAGLVWLLNLPSLVREVRHVRIAKPTRVEAEDQELAAPLTDPGPQSPWG